MRITRPIWSSIPVLFRGLIVSLTIVVILGTVFGLLLGRYEMYLETLDEASAAAAYVVWAMAAVAFAAVVFRRTRRM